MNGGELSSSLTKNLAGCIWESVWAYSTGWYGNYLDFSERRANAKVFCDKIVYTEVNDLELEAALAIYHEHILDLQANIGND